MQMPGNEPDRNGIGGQSKIVPIMHHLGQSIAFNGGMKVK
jgi:hypothetical protein